MDETFEEIVTSLNIWLYQEHTLEETKTKFIEICQQENLSHAGLKNEILAGRIDLFTEPYLLPVRPPISAVDVTRIIDEFAK